MYAHILVHMCMCVCLSQETGSEGRAADVWTSLRALGAALARRDDRCADSVVGCRREAGAAVAALGELVCMHVSVSFSLSLDTHAHKFVCACVCVGGWVGGYARTHAHTHTHTHTGGIYGGIERLVSRELAEEVEHGGRDLADAALRDTFSAHVQVVDVYMCCAVCERERERERYRERERVCVCV